jgi:tetratricopeptide (TPR) repeat protein
LNPGDRNTVLTCSLIFRALGKEDFAREVLQAYLTKNPQDNEIISLIESISGQSDESHSTDTAEFFQRQGEIQFERGNKVHAEACFEMAIEANPDMARAYNGLGMIELESGKITQALEHFYKALDLNPEDVEILGNSARALARAAQVDTAIDVYREYLRRMPKDSQAWAEFESLVRQTGASGWSPKDLSAEVAEIYLHSSENLRKAGDLRGAAEAIERCLKIKQPEPESLYELASLHLAIGQEDEAKKILDQALAIDPTNGPCCNMIQSLNRIKEFRAGDN